MQITQIYLLLEVRRPRCGCGLDGRPYGRDLKVANPNLVAGGAAWIAGRMVAT
ncbi:MAG: hypothetical protein LLG44_01015 [Chloroflexi bacterium]|nr:hypothetical protein [Chloroflexota bacterium]